MSGTYRLEPLVDGAFDDHPTTPPRPTSSPVSTGLTSRAAPQPVRHPGQRDRPVGGHRAVLGRRRRAPGAKGVPSRVDDWGPAYDHDWPTWWQMLPTYVSEIVP